MEKRDLLENSGYLRPNTSLEVDLSQRYDRRIKTGIFAVDAANKVYKQLLDAEKARELAEKTAVQALEAMKQAITEGLTDPLTGCFNRRHFDEYIEKRLDPSRLTQNVGFVFVDIDNLKDINDSGGHIAGDQAIIKTADHIRKNLRKGDELSRYGGDEFVIVSHLDEGDGTMDDSCLCDLMEARFRAESPYEFSIGCAIYDYHIGGDVYEVIDLADRRMYEQKAAKQPTSSKSEVIVVTTD